jgi:hypothetical protein
LYGEGVDLVQLLFCERLDMHVLLLPNWVAGVYYTFTFAVDKLPESKKVLPLMGVISVGRASANGDQATGTKPRRNSATESRWKPSSTADTFRSSRILGATFSPGCDP